MLASKEGTIATHHEKIMIGKVRQHDFNTVESNISELLSNINLEQPKFLVGKMKELVPEFISNNSEYSILDKKEVSA